jgi:hypothetical protein
VAAPNDKQQTDLLDQQGKALIQKTQRETAAPPPGATRPKSP